MPIDFDRVTHTWGFGPNKYAQEICSNNKNCQWYSSLRGLHNGLDFTAQKGTPLIWAGTSEGKVVKYVGNADPAIGILYGGKIVIYGHYSRNDTDINRTVRPGELIGLSGSDHLHFGLRKATIFYNPLWFFTQELQNNIITEMWGQGGYDKKYNPYYMISFDNQFNDKGKYWFWDTGCERLRGISIYLDPHYDRKH